MVVPVVPAWLNVDAFTEPLNVVDPVLVKATVLSGCTPPTAPENVISPNPVATVRLRAVDVVLFTVEVNVMSSLVLYVAPVGLALELVVASVIALAKSTGPVYVCDFRVEMFPFKEISVEEAKLRLNKERDAPIVDPKVIEPRPALIANVAGVEPFVAT
jgi:hypothetical protein